MIQLCGRWKITDCSENDAFAAAMSFIPNHAAKAEAAMNGTQMKPAFCSHSRVAPEASRAACGARFIASAAGRTCLRLLLRLRFDLQARRICHRVFAGEILRPHQIVICHIGDHHFGASAAVGAVAVASQTSVGKAIVQEIGSSVKAESENKTITAHMRKYYETTMI